MDHWIVRYVKQGMTDYKVAEIYDHFDVFKALVTTKIKLK